MTGMRATPLVNITPRAPPRDGAATSKTLLGSKVLGQSRAAAKRAWQRAPIRITDIVRQESLIHGKLH